MKVILTDNYNRDSVADILHAGPGLSLKEAHDKANHYNVLVKTSVYWAMVVEDDYRLSRGMEDLV